MGGHAQPFSIIPPGTVIKQGTTLTSLAKTAVKTSTAVAPGLTEAMGNKVASEELSTEQTVMHQVGALLQLCCLSGSARLRIPAQNTWGVFMRVLLCADSRTPHVPGSLTAPSCRWPRWLVCWSWLAWLCAWAPTSLPGS